MRTRFVLPLGIMLMNLIAAACEDDPTDLDYLKDASTAEVASGTGGASGSSGASAGSGGASAGASGSTSGAGGSATAGNTADAGE